MKDTFGPRVVVAYGDASFASGGVGERSVPTTQAYKECAARVRTYLVSEFRTSKVCCYDDTVLQQVATRSAPRTALRGLLINVVSGKWISRDLNAALNIRRLLVRQGRGEGRPDMLQRGGGGMERLEQRIVCRIKHR